MIVIKLGGAVCLQDAVLDEVAATYRDTGAFTLVHGAGPQLDQALAALGPTIRVQGLRVTGPEAAEIVRRVMDSVGAALAKALRARNVPAIHIPATLRLFSAQVERPELGRVGEHAKFRVDRLRAVVPPGSVAVVTPVGWDEEGPLNINADEGAAALATAVEAPRLVLATNVAHVRNADGEPIASMSRQTAMEFLASPAAQGGIVPKVQAALVVLDAGVPEVRIGHISCAAGVGGTCFIPE